MRLGYLARRFTARHPPICLFEPHTPEPATREALVLERKHSQDSLDALGTRPRHLDQSATADQYYGHEDTTKMCTRFITHLFSCPDVPPATSQSAVTPSLARIVAYALHRTRPHSSVTFCALYLLSRLKKRFPAARASSGHRLYIFAFMIASKVICDNTYSNKSWCVAVQGMFTLREVNQMERKMCSYFEWILNVKLKDLRDFEARIRASAALTPVAVPIPRQTRPVRRPLGVAPLRHL
ncbi:hypothetical protein FRC07_002873, partial [Ceratobasidium sp. 392]